MSVPVFVEIKDQEQVLDTVDSLKEGLLKAKKLLHDLYELRSQENEQLHKVRESINQTNQRIELVAQVFEDE